jgi:hypothetical protein
MPPNSAPPTLDKPARPIRSARFTVRRLMIVVLAFGLLFGFGWPAVQTFSETAYHVHFLIERGSDSRWTYAMRFVQAPFWLRYQLRLQGQSWKDQPSCSLGGSQGDEICGLERPDCIHLDPVTSAPWPGGSGPSRVNPRTQNWTPDLARAGAPSRPSAWMCRTDCSVDD